MTHNAKTRLIMAVTTRRGVATLATSERYVGGQWYYTQCVIWRPDSAKFTCARIGTRNNFFYCCMPRRITMNHDVVSYTTTTVTRTTLLKSARCRRGQGAWGTWRARFTMPGDRSSAGAAPAFCGVRIGGEAPTVRPGARAPNTGHAVRGRNSEASRPVSMALGRTPPGRDPWDANFLFSSISGCVAFFPVRTWFCVVHRKQWA